MSVSATTNTLPFSPLSTERFIVASGVLIDPWANEAIMDRTQAVARVASGEFSNIAQVIAFDLSKGTSRDATDEIARDVMTAWADDGDPLSDWQVDFLEQHVGIVAANQFARAA